jgi:hypothetical protein
LGILYGSRKYILLGVKKAKIGPQSPKTEFGAQNQYGRVIYPSIGNLIPFLGFEGLFSPFGPLKVSIFFIYTKFPIDGSHALFHF